MTTQNILLQVDNNLNFLCHSNTKGSHWYQHDPNKRWQRQAVYAKGQPNPDAKTSVGNRVKNAVVGIKARHDAKNDAAMNAIVNSKSGQYTRGHRHLDSQAVGVGVAAGVGVGIMNSVAGKEILDSIGDNRYRGLIRKSGLLIAGVAGVGATQEMQKAQYNNYVKRSRGTLKGINVSPAYKDAYKKTFNKYKDLYAKPLGDKNKSIKKWLDTSRASGNAEVDAYSHVFNGSKERALNQHSSKAYRDAYQKAYKRELLNAREDKRELRVQQHRPRESYTVKGQH